MEILLIQVHLVAEAETPVAAREDPDARTCDHRVVLECVRGTALHVTDAAEFEDRLEMVIRGEIDSDPIRKLIRTIEQHEVRAAEIALRIGREFVSDVSRDIHPPAGTRVDEECAAEISAA